MKSLSISTGIVATGAIFWINHNLGVLFWVLLGITLFDILYGVGADMLTQGKQRTLSYPKSIRGFSLMGIPVLIANFSSVISHGTIFSALQVVFAILILVQLQYVVPSLFSLFKWVVSKTFGQTQVDKTLDDIGREEIQKLLEDLQKKLYSTEKASSSGTDMSDSKTKIGDDQ